MAFGLSAIAIAPCRGFTKPMSRCGRVRAVSALAAETSFGDLEARHLAARFAERDDAVEAAAETDIKLRPRALAIAHRPD